jgi:hypothetical protein
MNCDHQGGLRQYGGGGYAIKICDKCGSRWVKTTHSASGRVVWQVAVPNAAHTAKTPLFPSRVSSGDSVAPALSLFTASSNSKAATRDTIAEDFDWYDFEAPPPHPTFQPTPSPSVSPADWTATPGFWDAPAAAPKAKEPKSRAEAAANLWIPEPVSNDHLWNPAGRAKHYHMAKHAKNFEEELDHWEEELSQLGGSTMSSEMAAEEGGLL